ncbi:AAA family ATPase [Pseudoflavitalea sp. G-6-1-2]|uniref:zeta toxin family protein n=1 Tax=Pseudoflavitalea sp. G-6-1-2 TaxID=2728841 RepID=UPI00146C4DDD|nr:zeta toxin family protein [Pseudoflavitalea sp. G-6-1-2]NML23486.1 AAA family ATPase [Pseudoflavitalea sp. G-6-1-2]
MPIMYIIAGCNGAGKTTGSKNILSALTHCNTYVNADDIAAELSPENPAAAAFEAGRIMLSQLEELLQSNADFAFETTLSTRSFAGMIRKAKSKGYAIRLFFLWLVSPEMAKQRVAARVKRGGHSIPEDVIERRYYRGVANFIHIYRNISDSWVLMDNRTAEPVQIAEGYLDKATDIRDAALWSLFVEHSTMVEEPAEQYGEGFTDRLIAAMMKSNYQMLIEAAAINESLVVGDGPPGFRHAPAIELLQEFERSEKFKSLFGINA